MYAYPNCGFEVFLLSGYEVTEGPRGTRVKFADLKGLHLAIARELIAQKRPLRKEEFRFLRKELDLSQRELGEYFGVTEQAVSLWEREGGNEIPFLVDVAVRELVSERSGLGGVGLETRLARAREAARAPAPRLTLRMEYVNEEWARIPTIVYLRSFRIASSLPEGSFPSAIESAREFSTHRAGAQQLQYTVRAAPEDQELIAL